MEERETGILCFVCGDRSGIDCPGRRKDEATRCVVCMEKSMKEFESQSQSSQSTTKRSQGDAV